MDTQTSVSRGNGIKSRIQGQARMLGEEWSSKDLQFLCVDPHVENLDFPWDGCLAYPGGISRTSRKIFSQ